MPTRGADDVQPLVPATLVVLHRHLGARISPHRVEVDSTIPRSVGLAGSSAIVIATIRAMISAHPDEPWARSLVAEPALLASLALAAEREILGIAAGLQDRVVQTLGGTVAMEFGARLHAHDRRLRGRDVPPAAAASPADCSWRIAPRRPADSGQVHAARRPRRSCGAPTPCNELRRCARPAADAIDAGDVVALGAAMDETFDQRASVMSLDPGTRRDDRRGPRHGASANYTGSGGAVIVLATDGEARAALTALGCDVLDLDQATWKASTTN